MSRATFGSYTWRTIENIQEANDGGRSRQTLSTLWILDLGIVFLFFFFFFCSFASRNYVTLLTLPLLNSACCLVDSSSSLEFYQNVFQDS